MACGSPSSDRTRVSMGGAVWTVDCWHMMLYLYSKSLQPYCMVLYFLTARQKWLMLNNAKPLCVVHWANACAVLLDKYVGRRKLHSRNNNSIGGGLQAHYRYILYRKKQHWTLASDVAPDWWHVMGITKQTTKPTTVPPSLLQVHLLTVWYTVVFIHTTGTSNITYS